MCDYHAQQPKCVLIIYLLYNLSLGAYHGLVFRSSSYVAFNLFRLPTVSHLPQSAVCVSAPFKSSKDMLLSQVHNKLHCDRLTRQGNTRWTWHGM